MISKEEAYLNARDLIRRKPASPPPDTPDEMRVGAESAIAFYRTAGEFSIGTCIACRESRLGATYRKRGAGREREYLPRVPLI